MLSLITFTNHLPFMVVAIAQLLFCYTALLVMMRLFGTTGIYVFMGIMVIAGNIEVNKLTLFPFYAQPIPLGTTLIAATYLSSDILAEYYGVKAARRGILIAFSAMVLMMLCMFFTLSFTPITPALADAAGMPQSIHIQPSLLALFSPAPALLLSSLTSFLLSQFTDVWIFMAIKKITGEKWLWLRNNLSTWVASLLDNIVFNLLAWRIFAHTPVPWHILIFGYILGTYILRVLVATFDTPFIYFAKKFHSSK